LAATAAYTTGNTQKDDSWTALLPVSSYNNAFLYTCTYGPSKHTNTIQHITISVPPNIPSMTKVQNACILLSRINNKYNISKFLDQKLISYCHSSYACCCNSSCWVDLFKKA